VVNMSDDAKIPDVLHVRVVEILRVQK